MTTDDLPKTPETLVYIFNMSEDVWPFIQAMSNPTARRHEIDENASLADRDLFSLSQDSRILFIGPKPISPEFLNYYQTLTKNRNIRTLTTSTHSGEICLDILNEESIINELVRTANSTKRLTLESYSTTDNFLKLVQHLRDRGLTIYTPESPETDDAWTVNFFGSKGGIRQLAQQSGALEPDFKMPDGLVVFGAPDAAKIAANKYLNDKGVVIKTNKGHSGAGMYIFRPGDLPLDYHSCVDHIIDSLQKDDYWSKFPVIVENYIPAAPSVGGGFPNVEFKILKSGKVELLYYCGMRLTPDGIFQGVEINQDVVSDKVAAQMVDTGFFIGERYAKDGYRGYFDVDFIASKNGDLFVTESNVRRTGGTYVYNTAMRLIGRDFMYESYILSNEYILPTTKKLSFPDLLTLLKPILYHHPSQEGLVIASENLLSQHKLAYIIFAKTKKRALDLEHQLETLLTT